MTRANTDRSTPWFAQAGAACSIIPVSRFVGPSAFALKSGGYGVLFALEGVDEEGKTDEQLDILCRRIEGALRGVPEEACLYQYTLIRSGFDIPRQASLCKPGNRSICKRQVGILRCNCKVPAHFTILDADD